VVTPAQEHRQRDDHPGDAAAKFQQLQRLGGAHRLFGERDRQHQHDHRDDPALQLVQVMHGQPARHQVPAPDLDVPDEQLVEAERRDQRGGADQEQVELQQQRADMVPGRERMSSDLADRVEQDRHRVDECGQCRQQEEHHRHQRQPQRSGQRPLRPFAQPPSGPFEPGSSGLALRLIWHGDHHATAATSRRRAGQSMTTPRWLKPARSMTRRRW
jgi:hypothetical protein